MICRSPGRQLQVVELDLGSAAGNPPPYVGGYVKSRCPDRFPINAAHVETRWAYKLSGKLKSAGPFGLLFQVIEHFAGFRYEENAFGFPIREIFLANGLGVAIAQIDFFADGLPSLQPSSPGFQLS